MNKNFRTELQDLTKKAILEASDVNHIVSGIMKKTKECAAKYGVDRLTIREINDKSLNWYDMRALYKAIQILEDEGLTLKYRLNEDDDVNKFIEISWK